MSEVSIDQYIQYWSEACPGVPVPIGQWLPARGDELLFIVH